MRNQKDKWAFYKMPSRPPISTAEAAYWKNMLSRILKVGVEFEFNLPEKKNGNCKGESSTCPCKLLAPESACWQQCINIAGCHAVVRSVETCENATEVCDGSECAACQHFKPKCVGILCSNFISYCYVCEKFDRDCMKCQFRYDPNKNPENIRKELCEFLKPSKTYGVINPSGVHSITTDGSLLGQKGAEIVTIGRRVDYWEFYKMCKNIIDSAVSRGAYVNERCSMHMHLLASYYGKLVPMPNQQSGIPDRVSEMERDMPEIILANFHQLVRRYQNAMTWMTMGLDDPKRMTRWEKFRVSVLEISAVTEKMDAVAKRVASNAGGKKYGWANYNNVEFSRDGSIRRFHVEMRAADFLQSPSAAAALACLYYALALKAVEISRYGLLEVGDESWMAQAKEVKKAILNNMKDYGEGDRFGDTSRIHKYQEILIGESLDLVRQMKSILIRIGPAYEVLEKLAERPIALRRCDGESWEKIEKDLEVLINQEGRLEIALSEIITLNQVAECNSLEEWTNAVGQVLRENPEMGLGPDNAELENNIQSYIEKRREEGELVWSKKIGAPILI